LGRFGIARFVAVGDGYVAGIADGGLFRQSQVASFPALIVQQLSLAQATTFVQPLLPANGSGFLSLEQWQPHTACAASPLTVRTTRVIADAAWATPVFSAGPHHNLGLPGLAPDAVTTVAQTRHNQYFARIEPEPDRLSYAAHTARVPATAFVCWLGLETLAGRAATGHAAGALPESAALTNSCTHLLDSLCKQGNVAGVVGTLPSAGLLPLCAATGTTYFTGNCDPLPIFITTGTGMVRAASGQDRVLLAAGPLLGQALPDDGSLGLSSLHPLPDSLVLDRDELANLDSLKDLYNTAWQTAVAAVNAQGNDVVLAPLAAAFTQLAQMPRTENGVVIGTAYLTGGIFSHDGYTLTPRGNAWVANQFLAVINTYFQASLPLLELGHFQGTKWP
jgi:hypothetical protein